MSTKSASDSPQVTNVTTTTTDRWRRDRPVLAPEYYIRYKLTQSAIWLRNPQYPMSIWNALCSCCTMSSNYQIWYKYLPSYIIILAEDMCRSLFKSVTCVDWWTGSQVFNLNIQTLQPNMRRHWWFVNAVQCWHKTTSLTVDRSHVLVHGRF